MKAPTVLTIAATGLAIALMTLLSWQILGWRDAPEGTAAPLSTPREATGVPTAVVPVERDDLGLVAAAVIARPLFSPERRPPSATRPTAPESPRADEMPRLSAVIVGPRDRRAIFIGADGKSRAVSEGDSIGGMRVRTIAPGEVTLTGPSGDRVVRPGLAPRSNPTGSDSGSAPDTIFTQGTGR